MAKASDGIRIASALKTLRDIQNEYGDDIKVSLGGPCLTVKEAIAKSKKAAKKKGFKIRKGALIG